MKILWISLVAALAITAGEIKMPVSFAADFTQKITSPKKKIIRYSGSMLLNRSGALKWRYKKPTKKEVCSNKKIFTIVDHDLEQVSFYELKKALDLAAILKKARHHKGNLYVANYEEVLYTFSLDKRGRIDQIAYKDNLDNVVNIHFQKMRYSKKPNSKRKMTCPYPKQYDIIKG